MLGQICPTLTGTFPAPTYRVNLAVPPVCGTRVRFAGMRCGGLVVSGTRSDDGNRQSPASRWESVAAGRCAARSHGEHTSSSAPTSRGSSPVAENRRPTRGWIAEPRSCGPRPADAGGPIEFDGNVVSVRSLPSPMLPRRAPTVVDRDILRAEWRVCACGCATSSPRCTRRAGSRATASTPRWIRRGPGCGRPARSPPACCAGRAAAARRGGRPSNDIPSARDRRRGRPGARGAGAAQSPRPNCRRRLAAVRRRPRRRAESARAKRPRRSGAAARPVSRRSSTSSTRCNRSRSPRRCCSPTRWVVPAPRSFRFASRRRRVAHGRHRAARRPRERRAGRRGPGRARSVRRAPGAHRGQPPCRCRGRGAAFQARARTAGRRIKRYEEAVATELLALADAGFDSYDSFFSRRLPGVWQPTRAQLAAEHELAEARDALECARRSLTCRPERELDERVAQMRARADRAARPRTGRGPPRAELRRARERVRSEDRGVGRGRATAATSSTGVPTARRTS